MAPRSSRADERALGTAGPPPAGGTKGGEEKLNRDSAGSKVSREARTKSVPQGRTSSEGGLARINNDSGQADGRTQNKGGKGLHSTGG